MMAQESLLLLGAGHPEYRWWELDQFRSRYRLKLITAREPTWESAYFSEIEVADPADELAVSGAAERLMKDDTVRGLLSYHEPATEVTARLSGRLGLPSLSAQAAWLCRDKHAARRAFAEHGVPSAESRLVHGPEEALAAATEIGYPVIVKPRALVASFGVSLAEDETQVRHAFTVANKQVLNEPWNEKPPGVLIEEYLNGPEISVDSLAVAGRVTPLIFAKKLLGFPPYREEVGHIVGPAEAVCAGQATEVADVVLRAHAAIGVQHGATNAELKLTPSGVRVIELNGRSGGDCTGYLGYLASGVNLALGAAAAACGEEISLYSWRTPPGTSAGAAGIRFCYPAHAGVIRSLGFAAALQQLRHIDRLELMAHPGQRVEVREGRLYNSRIAFAIVAGATTAQCADRLEQAATAFSCDIVPSSE